MTQRKRKLPTTLDMTRDEAVARFIQTDKKELGDSFPEMSHQDQEVEKYFEERRESIKRGATRARNRFRL
jgi:hypothetical protein